MTIRIRISHPLPYLGVVREVGTVLDVDDAFGRKAIDSGYATESTGAVTPPPADPWPQYGARVDVERLKYANRATAANAARLMNGLRRGQRDLSMLVVSDSTMNAQDEAGYLALTDLAARFPAYTVRAVFWNETTQTAYQAPVTVQTGTGARVLTVHFAAASGTDTGWFRGTRWAAAIAPLDPDLILVNHGHNTGDPLGSAQSRIQQRNGLLALTEDLNINFPMAGLVLTSQNPTYMTGREVWQEVKADIWEEVAGLRGYGFIDAHRAFVDTGRPRDYVKTDNIHPTTAADVGSPNGSRLWADVISAALIDAGWSTPTDLSPSPALMRAPQFLANPEFAAWTGTDPDSWTPNTFATTSKDTTNRETGAHGCKVTGTAASGGAQIEQIINLGPAGHLQLRGQWVTVAARVFVPAGNTSVVRVQLSDSTGGANANNADIPGSARDRFVWVFATKRIDPASTLAVVRLISRTTGAAQVDATFDRAYLVRGVLPASA